MHLDDAFGYGEPQAGATLLARDRIVGLLEFLEQLGLIGSGDAGPVSRTDRWNDPPVAVALMTPSPASVNVMALPTRLITTSVKRRPSPGPLAVLGVTSTLNAEFLSAAKGSSVLRTVWAISSKE